MNGVSVATVTSAGASYDIYGPSSNQENQDGRKVATNGARPSTANTSRSPLGSLPASRKDAGNDGSNPQPAQLETTASAKAKSKNTLEVETRQKFSANNASMGNVSNADSEDIPENMYRPEKYEAEGWIHREKLAKIENEELQAAGINLAKARTKSRDTAGDRLRTASRDRLRSDFASTEGSVREEKKRKVSSPVPVRAEDEDENNDQRHWDLRTPEEIAADQMGPQSYTTPVLRRSGSKIPVLSPNTNSVSPESLERGSSVPKKRTLSGTVSNDDSTSSPGMRTTSPNWNEDAGDPTSPALRKTSSPTKVRQKSGPSNAAPSSTAKTMVPRKTSISKSSTAPPNGRPRTRGNDSDRPKTNTNHPEGDPPWLMDMYKPDPRLPPDQQLIPTIAKKQRQMQWEESGKIPKTYDREFTALAVHENGEPAVAQPAESEAPVERPEDSESWPLKPMPNIPISKEGVTKINTNSSPPTTGGYSTMPKVTSPPMSIASPKIGSSTNGNFGATSPLVGPTRQTGGPQQQTQVIQQRPLSDAEDEKVQKKGCGCCVVM